MLPYHWLAMAVMVLGLMGTVRAVVLAFSRSDNANEVARRASEKADAAHVRVDLLKESIVVKGEHTGRELATLTARLDSLKDEHGRWLQSIEARLGSMEAKLDTRFNRLDETLREIQVNGCARKC